MFEYSLKTYTTPSILFCEKPYAVTPSIAEYFNTLSSMSYVGVGVFYFRHIWQNQSVFPKVYQLLIALHLILIGCGSALFHAIPRFDIELLDELPMLSLMFVLMYYVVVKHPWLSFSVPMYRYIFYGLFICVVGTTLHYMNTQDYGYFFIPFSILLFINIGLSIHYCQLASASQKERKQLTHTLILLLCSQIAWQMEQHFVRSSIESIHCYWLHAVWHVLSALGLYVWLM